MKQLWLGLIVILVLFLSACSNENSPPDVDALVYENAKPLSDFTLNDQRGELVTKQQFLGQWNLVFLGYTSCPDICPLTLAKLNAVYKTYKQIIRYKFGFYRLIQNAIHQLNESII